MLTLTPVEGDPFAPPAQSVTLTPVEHDPFDPLSASAGVSPPSTSRIDQIDWGRPSWTEQAAEQLRRDQEAYARGGVPEMMRDTQTTQDLAGGFGGGGIGIAGTFGGKLAKTANQEMLARAMRMTEEGHPRESIWNQTGWFQGPDKKWRFEIPDQRSTVALNKENLFGTADQVFEHPELYEAYPSLARHVVDVNPEAALERQRTGGFTPSKDPFRSGYIKVNAGGAEPSEQARSVLLHEMQHGVQDIEGFSGGGNLYKIPGRRRSATPDWDTYQRAAGEVEARNVQERADFEHRQVPPWETASVSEDMQIVGRGRPATLKLENAPGGLDINLEEGLERLRLNQAREEKARTKGTEVVGAPSNPRTVIKAPEGSGLPDFVAGRPTFNDWIDRHEKLLHPDEIYQASRWYKDIYDNFLRQTKGDEQTARKYMRSWLVAQQNIDVSGAMHNVLLQKEQLARGVPLEEMRAGGMPNPTAAARNVLQGQQVTGVGQKISDFVDSAEGKEVRSWMANHPGGGQPFVVDVHTARDTGMVDQELKNHLTRLGYDPEVVAGLKTDLGTSPSSPQYENRAKFGRELTAHLNDIGWQGRKDWTPAEVQAVGWMGMTKLTAGKAEDVGTGLANNMRNISMELSPGEGSPWAQKYGSRFSNLPAAEQYALTHHVVSSAIDHASRIAGIDVRDIVHGTGGWQNFQNPSTVAQAFASKDGAEIAANVLGHLLNQTEVWSTKVKAPTTSPKGYAVDFVADGEHQIGTDEGLRSLWQKITNADPLKATKKPLFEGYQPIITRDGKRGIRVLIDRGGAGVGSALQKAVDGPVRDVLAAEPGDWHTHLHEAEITKARNDWKEQPNGQGYKSRLVPLLRRNPTADLDIAGAQLEKTFNAALDAAEARSGASAGSSTEAGMNEAAMAAFRAAEEAGWRDPHPVILPKR
jgi:hypothetical protein